MTIDGAEEPGAELTEEMIMAWLGMLEGSDEDSAYARAFLQEAMKAGEMR